MVRRLRPASAAERPPPRIGREKPHKKVCPEKIFAVESPGHHQPASIVRSSVRGHVLVHPVRFLPRHALVAGNLARRARPVDRRYELLGRTSACRGRSRPTFAQECTSSDVPIPRKIPGNVLQSPALPVPCHRPYARSNVNACGERCCCAIGMRQPRGPVGRHRRRWRAEAGQGPGPRFVNEG